MTLNMAQSFSPRKWFELLLVILLSISSLLAAQEQEILFINETESSVLEQPSTGTIEPKKMVKGDEIKDKSANTLVISFNRDPFLSRFPASVNYEHLDLSTSSGSSNAVLDALGAIPGIGVNGQGGLFQTYSIRGVAKHRVKTLVENVSILSDRRAGVSASFIDPSLIASVDVIRGPVSTYYGSGALGGAVNLLLGHQQNRWNVGTTNNGSANSASINWIVNDQTLGASVREQANSNAANGIELNDGFQSLNGLYKTQGQFQDWRWSFLWLETKASDIGKSNLRYPDERITTYPEEKHRIVTLTATNQNDFSWTFSLHPNELVTENIRVGSRTDTSFNESKDFNLSIKQSFPDEWPLAFQLGADWFGRRNVNAYEIREAFVNSTTEYLSIIDNGSVDDLGFFVSGVHQNTLFNLHLGARLNWQSMSVREYAQVNDFALSGFFGFEKPFNEKHSLNLNLASGFRFPSLSERFFSGTTARGEIIGVENLDSERSNNIDLSLDLNYAELSLSFGVFLTNVDHYIERITLESGANTYVNIEEAKISGVEASIRKSFEQTDLSVQYTQYNGKSNSGGFLADIPASKLLADYRWRYNDWSLFLAWSHQRAKNKVGPGELASGSFNRIDANISYFITKELELSVSIDNLLDELYIASNDDLDTWATGQKLSIQLKWTEF